MNFGSGRAGFICGYHTCQANFRLALTRPEETNHSPKTRHKTVGITMSAFIHLQAYLPYFSQIGLSLLKDLLTVIDLLPVKFGFLFKLVNKLRKNLLLFFDAADDDFFFEHRYLLICILR